MNAPLEPLNVGGLMLVADPAFVDQVASFIATPPAHGQYDTPTAGPLAFAARTQPALRTALLGLVRALDDQRGWS